MIYDYLKKQWNYIEHTKKVISIKNLARELSFISNKRPSELIEITNKFFRNKNDALFVNDNQVIDKKTLLNKNISNVEQLSKILHDEYFVMYTDKALLLSYLNKKNIIIADPPHGGERWITKKQIPVPYGLFKSFYFSCIRWAKITNSDTKKARLIWQYLNNTEVPCTVYDIYFNLCGALFDLSINEVNKILYDYENFAQVCRGYWTVKIDEGDIGKRIQILNILHNYTHNQQLYNLLEIYTEKTLEKQKFILIDDVIKDLEIINMHVIKADIEKLFIKLGLVELVPNHWTRKKGNISTTKFNLADLWNDTCNNIENIIKNQRNIEVFTSRIIENETLEQVGNRMGVTRERIRQIEKKIRRKMVHPRNSKIIKPFYKWFKNKLKIEKIVDLEKIGIKKQEFKVFDIITQRYFSDKEIYRILDNIVIYKPEYDRLSKEINNLSSHKKIMNLAEIPLHTGLSNKLQLYNKIFVETMNIIKIDENEYFYSGRKPTKEEEIFIIIYKSQKPLHFEEVPKQAKKLNLPLSTEEGRNILATMQRNNLLKRVSPGVYALKEWDIPKHIYITDLVYKVLKDADRPMYYDEIFTAVSENRIDQIKETSVQYYLDSHEEITRIHTKQYILKEWINEPEKLIKHGIGIERIKKNDLLYGNKVILDVFKKGNSYITKYKLSEASSRAAMLRISRYVELDLESHIVVIDRHNNFHFHSYGYEVISGINRWKYISIDDIFYVEFINERIARLFTAGEFKKYVPIDNILLEEAENFWDKQMKKLDGQETEVESVVAEIKKEGDSGDYIFVKTAEEEYKIKNNEDLINFGLKNTCISFDLLEQYCKLFNRSQFEIRFFLNDRDIKLTSDKIEFVVYKKDRLDMVDENKIKEYMPIKKNMEKKNINDTTFSYKSNIKINEDIDVKKTTILNLRLNEIIAMFLNISCIGNRISYHSSKNFFKKHLSEFEKIGLLEKERKKGKRIAYIVTDECINIADKLKSLSLTNFTPNKNLFMDKKIASKNNIKVLFSYIRKDFINVLKKFDDFKFLLRLINDLDNIGRYTMMDIVKYCIENKYESEFVQIFIGNKGTAGKGAIISGKDICCSNITAKNICGFSCDACYKKHNINLNNKVDKLLYVRDVIAAKRYQEIVTGRDLKILVDDPLTLKFLVRFGVTYYNKNILRALGVIDSQVHMKSTGEYCPYRDEWRVSKNEV